MKWLTRRADQAVPPDEIRAAREALGWSQEQLAEAAGVLPAEVAAWESGAVAVSPYERDVVRWKLETAAYQERLPRGCAWAQAQEPRWTRLAGIGPHLMLRVLAEQEAHTHGCAECQRAAALARDLPPPPEEPVPPGFRGWRTSWRRWRQRLPGWLKLPVILAESAIPLGALYLAGVFTPPFEPFIAGAVGAALGFYLNNRMERFSREHPYLQGQVLSAAVAASAVAVYAALGQAPSSDLYPLIAVGSVVLGWLIAEFKILGRREETELLAELDAASERSLPPAPAADPPAAAPPDAAPLLPRASRPG